MASLKRIKNNFLVKMEKSIRSSYKTDYANFSSLYDLPTDDLNFVYNYYMWKFSKCVPTYVRQHRAYFSSERRGFGEDAFHAFWYDLFSHFRFKSCLEIGVYRGQTVSLWALMAEQMEFESQYIAGISPFESIGDEVSNYDTGVNYLRDTEDNIRYFCKSKIDLIKDYSNSSSGLEFINHREWDLIYIDGSHDYKVVLSDLEISKRSLAQGGVIVMDDSSLYSSYRPGRISFAGHPGPSKVCEEAINSGASVLVRVGHLTALQFNRCC